MERRKNIFFFFSLKKRLQRMSMVWFCFAFWTESVHKYAAKILQTPNDSLPWLSITSEKTALARFQEILRTLKNYVGVPMTCTSTVKYVSLSFFHCVAWLVLTPSTPPLSLQDSKFTEEAKNEYRAQGFILMRTRVGYTIALSLQEPTSASLCFLNSSDNWNLSLASNVNLSINELHAFFSR